MSSHRQTNSELDNNDDWHPWTMDELPAVTSKKIHSENIRKQPTVKNSANPNTSPSPSDQEEKKKGYTEGLKAGREDGHKAGFEAGKKEGYEQGLKEGREKATKELANQASATLTPLASLVHRFEKAMTLLDTDITAELVELALAVGCQLARGQLDEQPELILDVVQELLHMDPSMNSKPRLWLHPEDLSLVEQHLGDEFIAAGWKLQPDKQLSRGGCKLTSTNEEYDATWETRCKVILSQVRQRRAPGPKVIGIFPQ